MYSLIKLKKNIQTNVITKSSLFSISNLSNFSSFEENKSNEQFKSQLKKDDYLFQMNNSILLKSNLSRKRHINLFISENKLYRLIHFNKSYFSDKPNKEEHKPKEEEESKEEQPPKGFEKFYRKKKLHILSEEQKDKINTNTKQSEESSKNKEDKNQQDKQEKPEKEENEKEDEEKEERDEKQDKDKKPNENEQLKIFLMENSVYILGILVSSLYILFYQRPQIKEVTVNEFNNYVQQRQIKSIEITKDKISSTFFNVLAILIDDNIVKLTIINHEQFLKGLETLQYELNIPEKEFIPIKLTSTPTAQPVEDNTTIQIVAYMGFIFCNIKLIRNFRAFQMRNLKGKTKGKSGSDFGKTGFRGLNDIFDISKTTAKEYGTEQKVNVKFKQVAGMEQAKTEVCEFVDFLKRPEKYHKLGAKIPRGALLVGPPGTGKTLLAKAVAGEAGVPFFAISGSDFVEMFVGVGAARVRDLFKKAKEKSPSILFIDEIDAVGRKRGGKFTGGHDERDNTLNQLLVEMDGFGTESNVIVLGATNRADILDPALLRPGRFDRQIEISLPDRKDREEIFKIYLKKVKTDLSKSIEEYAIRLSTLTPGFSGADISNLVNEAAIISARENKTSVDSVSFEKATDRIIAGLETRRLLSEKERKIVAFHESGHAVIGWFLEHSSPLVKLTIIPRSKGALGFTQFVPDDVYLRSREHLIDLICGLLGGRMTEEYFFGSITTGASDDLQKVTNIANAMVTKYGMSKLGLLAYGESDEPYSISKPFSPHSESVNYFK